MVELFLTATDIRLREDHDAIARVPGSDPPEHASRDQYNFSHPIRNQPELVWSLYRAKQLQSLRACLRDVACAEAVTAAQCRTWRLHLLGLGGARRSAPVFQLVAAADRNLAKGYITGRRHRRV